MYVSLQEYKWVLEVSKAAFQNSGVNLWWTSKSFKNNGKTSNLFQQKHCHKGTISKTGITMYSSMDQVVKWILLLIYQEIGRERKGCMKPSAKAHICIFFF